MFMKKPNDKQLSSDRNFEKLANKHHGPEGVDKAPGEETSEDIENVVAQTQKGKNKDDGDPSKESDQPIDNE
jgi:hypothetical protein